MTKKLMATVLAASIALTAIGTTPVQANNDDTAKIIGGLVALYVVSRIIKDKRERKSQTLVAVAPTLPERCLKTFYTPRGTREAYGAYCLNTYAPEISLPQECKRRISTDRGLRNVYGPNCLREHGYQVNAW